MCQKLACVDTRIGTYTLPDVCVLLLRGCMYKRARVRANTKIHAERCDLYALAVLVVLCDDGKYPVSCVVMDISRSCAHVESRRIKAVSTMMKDHRRNF
jgi:hypothetical protein